MAAEAARSAGIGATELGSYIWMLALIISATPSPNGSPLAASAAALELAKRSDLADSPVWIGTLAGLFAAILMAMLMITYHTKPGEMPKLRSRR